ncbi:hydroxymethylglutaryl-CoA lyase [Amycolatopsis sp. 3B14]|uniref:hydroxymethylglutaryl-CoA lyase n=1 Tax=Amycolatopsis sp. 3B14 TaxID=3243600 RepID=UPI003D97407B
MPVKVSVCDVGPRDGLQNESRVLAPEVRAELCARLAAAGLQRIEAVSFVRDDRVPAMAGAEAVLEAVDKTGGVRWAGLVLNERGYARAVEAGVDEIRYGLPVTAAFAERNQRTTVDAALDLGLELVNRARHDGIRCTVSLAVAFGCPFEGAVQAETVLGIAEKVLAAGPDELILADSIGVGVPRQVRALVGELVEPGRIVGCHFHNTRNTGYANALAAVEAGATVLDSSVGGLGGCPFAPGATGNIATEDLVYLLEGMGYDTGVDLNDLRSCSRWLAEQVGHELPSLVARAGDPCGVASSAS